MSRWRDNAAPYAAYSAALTLLFAGVYGSTNWHCSIRDSRYRFYWDWERQLPFVPELILIYLSIGFVFALPLFVLPRRELRPFAAAFALATVAAGAVFALLPAPIGFERSTATHGLEPVFRLLYRLDNVCNTLPSLHVTYGTLTMLALARHVPSKGARIGLWLWLASMFAAVILIRQHHVADVVAGVGLGAFCYGCFARWSEPIRSGKESPEAYRGSDPESAAGRPTS